MASVMYCLALGGRLARFGVEPLQQVGGIVPGVALDLLEQQLLGFVGGQAGDPLELVLLLRRRAVRIRGGRFGAFSRSRALARGVQLFLEPLDAACRSASWRLAPRQRLFERLRLLALLPRLAFGLRQDLVRLLLGVEQRFLLARFGVALGVLDDAERLLLGAADGFGGDALAVGDPDGEHRAGGHQRDDDVDADTEIGNTRDVLSRDPRRVAMGRRRAREVRPAKLEGAGGSERKAPLCRVGRSMNLRKQVEPLRKAALQASSHRGMHTTRRRDSLG